MAEQFNIITDEALTELFSKIKSGLKSKVDTETGKGLSENDFTTALKTAYDKAVTDVKALTDAGAEANKIDTVKVNGNALTPDTNKAVDISVPTTADIKSQIEAYDYQTATDVENTVTGKGYQTAAQVETTVTGKGYQTATQVNSAIEGKGYQTATQVQDAINESLSGVTGIDLQVVTSLPETGEKGVIYLIAHEHGAQDIYDEYVWVSSASKFEKIGSTDIDLSAYAKTADFTEVDAAEIDTLWDSVTT